MKAFTYFLFSTIVFGIAVIFVMFSFQNGDQVQLHLFSFSSPTFPVSGYIMVTFFLGMVFGGLFFMLPLLKMKASKMALQKQIKKTEKELHQLRNQPLDEMPKNASVEVAKLVEKEETSPPHYIQSR